MKEREEGKEKEGKRGEGKRKERKERKQKKISSFPECESQEIL